MHTNLQALDLLLQYFIWSLRLSYAHLRQAGSQTEPLQYVWRIAAEMQDAMRKLLQMHQTKTSYCRCASRCRGTRLGEQKAGPLVDTRAIAAFLDAAPPRWAFPLDMILGPSSRETSIAHRLTTEAPLAHCSLWEHLCHSSWHGAPLVRGVYIVSLQCSALDL